MKRFLWIIVCLMLPSCVQAQIKTVVTGSNLLPTGGSLSGKMTISAQYQFVTADGYTVNPNAPTIISISGGKFSVAVLPNYGSSPTPSYYKVVFNLNSSTGPVTWTEYWSVPGTGPVNRNNIQAYPLLPFPIGIVGVSSGGTGASTAPPYSIFGNPSGSTAAPSFGLRFVVCGDATHALGFGLSGIFCQTLSGGGAGNPGGLNGQIQWNNAGVFGGFTMSGDCSLAVPIITCTGSNGVPFAAAATHQPASTDLTDYAHWTGAAFGSQTANYFFAAPNGSAGNMTPRAIVPEDLPSTSVTPGSYTNSSITVDQQGRITAASSGAGSGVSSVSGDGTLITNSASTGAVALTLGNAAQNSMWGGPASGGPGGPSYQTDPTLNSLTLNGGLTAGGQIVSGSPGFCIQSSCITVWPSGGGGGLSIFTSQTTFNPLFTTSVTNPTTTPNLGFAQIAAAQNSVLAGPASGGAGAYSFQTAPTISALNMTNFPMFNQNTTGTAANLSGTPTLPNGTRGTTQTSTDNSTLVATDAFVQALIPSLAGYAPINSPTFTGTVTIPTGASISGYALLASPAFSGTPTAPTKSCASNTDIATGAYVANCAPGPTPYPGPGVAVSTGSAWGTSLGTTGSGSVVLSTGASLTAPNLGTPVGLTLTNATGLPLSTGVVGNIQISNIAGGSGASSSTFLRGDNTWATPAGAGNVSTTGSPFQYQTTVFSGGTTVTGIGPGTTGYPLVSGGASAYPSFTQLNLSTGVTGTLSAANLPGSGVTTIDTVSCTIGGACTTTHLNGVAFGASPGLNTVPVVTSTNTTTYEAVPNAALANDAMTFNGVSAVLGGSGTLVLGSSNFVNQGTTTTVLHGNAAGNPSWGSVSLTTDVSGVLPTANLPVSVVYSTISNSYSGGTKQTMGASTTGIASLNIPSGTAPTSPASGDIWNASGILKFYDGTHTNSFTTIQGGVTSGHLAIWSGTLGLMIDGGAIPATIPYPGAGVAVSTGSAWSTSLSTSGTGTTLCLTTGCVMVAPALGTPTALNLANATNLPYSSLTGTVPTWNQSTTGLSAGITGFTVPTPAGIARVAQIIAQGTIALATSSVTTGTCQTVTAGSVNSATATGVTTSDRISWNANGSIKAVSGFIPSTSGGFSIEAYPTAGFVNFDVCNWTGTTQAPGAVTVNYEVVR